LCAELCAEIRYEYRIFLANLCLAVHREDLIQWCFEYTPGPPPSTLLPLSWQSGTTIFATSPRHITADGDTSQQPLQRVFLVGEDLLATATNTPPLKRPVGHVHIHGQVRYVTFYKDGTRKTVRLGTVAELPNEDEARRLADEVIRTGATDRPAIHDILHPPHPEPTFAQFVHERFLPEFVDQGNLSHAGRCHYASILKYVLPALGDTQLLDVGYENLRRLINQKKEEGYSWQTLKHIRNCISAIFRHAIERTHHHPGPNPARGIILPPKEVTRQSHAATVEQCRVLLAALPCHPRPAAREMVRVVVCCGLSQAEFLALRWHCINLEDKAVVVDGEMLAPKAARICAGYYKGKFGRTKTPARNRDVPLPAKVVEELKVLRARGHHVGADDLVFCTKTGHHHMIKNITDRILNPIAAGLGIKIAWHELRHTHSTLVQALGMSHLDAEANMGHLGGNMTLHYTHPDLERRRGPVEELSRLIAEPAGVEGSKLT
jgi:integrase